MIIMRCDLDRNGVTENLIQIGMNLKTDIPREDRKEWDMVGMVGKLYSTQRTTNRR